MTMIDECGANRNVNSAAFIAAISGQDSTLTFCDLLVLLF